MQTGKFMLFTLYFLAFVLILYGALLLFLKQILAKQILTERMTAQKQKHLKCLSDSFQLHYG